MPQSKTTSSRFAVAFLSQLQDSKDLIILNVDDCKNFKNHYSLIINDDNVLYNVIPTKQNFFYSLECYQSKNLIFAERGVGEIYKKYKKYYLKREYSIYFNDSTGFNKTQGEIFRFPSTNCEIICKPYIPESYIDLFVYPHSVMCSIQRGVPTPVELEEKTLIGRLDDTVQSIDADELRTILTDTNIVDAVETTNKPLSLKSKVVDLVDQDARVSAPIIQARPVYSNTKRPQGRRGMIIYNSETNCFEGFDGNAWRPLLWGDL